MSGSFVLFPAAFEVQDSTKTNIRGENVEHDVHEAKRNGKDFDRCRRA